MSLAYKYILSIGCKLFIKCNKVFVLPEPDGPIISILNGQSLLYKVLHSEELLSFFILLLLTISSKFNILHFNIIFDLNIPTNPFKYF